MLVRIAHGKWIESTAVTMIIALPKNGARYPVEFHLGKIGQMVYFRSADEAEEAITNFGTRPTLHTEENSGPALPAER